MTLANRDNSMTHTYALLIKLMRRYLALGHRLTSLGMRKLARMLREAGVGPRPDALTIGNAHLRRLASRHRPPQQWFEEDDNPFQAQAAS